MEKNNVYSSAKILSKNDDVQNYQLGSFINNTQTETVNSHAVLNNKEINGNMDPVLNEIRALTGKISQIDQKNYTP